jgi:hypothetical protein
MDVDVRLNYGEYREDHSLEDGDDREPNQCSDYD